MTWWERLFRERTEILQCLFKECRRIDVSDDSCFKLKEKRQEPLIRGREEDHI